MTDENPQGSIITAVAMAAIALPSLSQTHWVARSCWISSLITSLLAVHFATAQAWTISQLTTEKHLRRWIRNTEAADNDGLYLWLKLNGEADDNVPSETVLDGLAPAPTAVITVSAPSLLLSSSLLLLLAGMGVFLGFVWTRDLDADASAGDSRAVFTAYIAVTAFSLGMTGVFSLGKDPIPARSVILDSLMELQGVPTAEKVEKRDLVAYRQLRVQKEMRDMVRGQREVMERLLERIAVLGEERGRRGGEDGEKGKEREVDTIMTGENRGE